MAGALRRRKRRKASVLLLLNALEVWVSPATWCSCPCRQWVSEMATTRQQRGNASSRAQGATLRVQHRTLEVRARGTVDEGADVLDLVEGQRDADAPAAR
ncbi:unnamed protein product [Prorocentrum cordatum]|uniref:Secreted protein n=1 Tax=Prorocentrum cordatum TaxID=2364126 RepID=A0ABN9WAC8_9DINO|nr:unnamed protein product [Polarella glacialis]